MEINTASLSSLRQALDEKRISAVELTQFYLARMNEARVLNAFISCDSDFALKKAQEVDLLIAKGIKKPLLGIPMAHKDIFCTAHFPTTCASKMLENYYSPFSATIVNRLEEAGVIVLGKTNMDEFAMGSTNENSYFGPVLNPWDKTRVSGGSSGGSAAAVAVSLAAFATASDTGGSIRQPASYCGVSGIKPTYGLASRYGMVAYASSLDQAGPIAKSAEDLAIILSSMLGFDANDSTSINRPIPNYSEQLRQSIKGKRVGLPRCFFKDLSPAISNIIQNAAKTLEQAGAILIDVDLNLEEYWIPCYYIIACAEASSNLARYDGIRFGYRSTQAQNIEDLIASSRSEAFGKEVKRRILTGTFVLSSGAYDAYYEKALKVRRLIQEDLLNAFESVDMILGPTAPGIAPVLNQQCKDVTENYLQDLFTVIANLAGLPALSIPAGFVQDLPVGLHILGKPFAEGELLNLAHQYQRATDWHLKTPQGYR